MNIHNIITKANEDLLSYDAYILLDDYIKHIVQILNKPILLNYKTLFDEFRSKTITEIEFITKMNIILDQHIGKQKPKIFKNTHTIITPDNVINCCNETAKVIMNQYYWFNDIVVSGYSDYQIKYKMQKLKKYINSKSHEKFKKQFETLQQLIKLYDAEIDELQSKIKILESLKIEH